MTALPSHEDMVGNIVAKYGEASHEQRLAGYRWYPVAGRIVDAIAVATDVPAIRVTYALAALSPRNPWLWNVQDAYSFAVASRSGEPKPSATTFLRNQHAAWQALTTGDKPWLTAAPKVRAFVAAILGDRSAVVVDTWAYRVATGESPAHDITGRRLGSFRGSIYAAIAAAYVDAAKQLGQDPRDVQAITWVVAQTEGLASNRRAKVPHGYKAGTADFVRGITK